MPVVAIGKIEDLFAGRGMTRAVAHDERRPRHGRDRRARWPRRRSRPDLREPRRLRHACTATATTSPGMPRTSSASTRGWPRCCRGSRPATCSIVTADHGNDPTTPIDRSLARARAAARRRRGGARPASTSARAPTFADLGQTLAEHLRRRPLAHGTSFLRDLITERAPWRIHPRTARSARASSILAPAGGQERRQPRAGCAPEPQDAIRPAFQRDRDRIIHSKAFRRLKHKTQVFFAPTGDHYRTRLTHTLEVSQIARTHRQGAAAARGADRGDRARPRSRAHAVRPRRRARHRPARARRLQPLRAEPAHRRRARERPAAA